MKHPNKILLLIIAAMVLLYLVKDKILNAFGVRTVYDDAPKTQADYVDNGNGSLTPHFDFDEFLQSDTARNNKIAEQYTPSPTVKANITKLAKKLEPARVKAGIPFIFSSGYRCERLNTKVGGEKNSAHLYGLAVDIRYNSLSEAKKIVEACIAAGFKRIGLGWSFIHVDIDTTKPQYAVWVYGKTSSSLKALERHYEDLMT